MPERALDWQDARLQRVLNHELTHIARHDWLWHGVIEVLLACVWFMPRMRQLKERFNWYSELNADDAVLNFDDNRTAYATDLLEIVQTIPKQRNLNSSQSGSVALIDRSYCFERIAAVLDGSRLRAHAPMRSRTLLSVLSACLLWSVVAAFRMAPLPADDAMSIEPAIARSPLVIYPTPKELSTFGGDTEKPVLRFQPMPNRPMIEEVVTRARIEPINSALLQQAIAQEIAADKVGAKITKSPLQFMPTVELQGYVPIQLVTPEYPLSAQRRKIEGRVTARFDISTSGQVHNIEITQSTAGNMFDKSVVAALQQSRFKPTLQDGLPITTQRVEHIYTFKLSDND